MWPLAIEFTDEFVEACVLAPWRFALGRSKMKSPELPDRNLRAFLAIDVQPPVATLRI
jgi:hypothetical protein